MRNLAMARPAIKGPLTSFVFAVVLASAGASVHAQDLLVPPSGPSSDMPMHGSSSGEMPPPRLGSSSVELPPPQITADEPSSASPQPVAVTEPVEGGSTDLLAPPSQVAPKAPPSNGAVADASGEKKPNKPAAKLGQDAGVQVASRSQTNDIYDQWSAKKLQKGRGYGASSTHILSTTYPDHFVVVCEGGCKNNQPQIVYMEERDARGPVYETSAQNSSSESDFVACVGGCYTTAVNQPLYVIKEISMPAVGSGSWLTTTTEASSSSPTPATGGRWYERINGEKKNEAETSH